MVSIFLKKEQFRRLMNKIKVIEPQKQQEANEPLDLFVIILKM